MRSRLLAHSATRHGLRSEINCEERSQEGRLWLDLPSHFHLLCVSSKPHDLGLNEWYQYSSLELGCLVQSWTTYSLKSSQSYAVLTLGLSQVGTAARG